MGHERSVTLRLLKTNTPLGSSQVEVGVKGRSNVVVGWTFLGQ